MLHPTRRLLLMRAVAAATLQPGRPSGFSLGPADPDQVAFTADGVPGAVTVPQARARIAFLLPIANREIAGIAFAADPPGATLDLVALVGWDSFCLRILGLEVLTFTGADGASLSSRFAGVGDHSRLAIARTAAIPRPGVPRRWENWIDFLKWRDQAPLADTPVRQPLPGTRQSDLATIRAQTIARLTPACGSITPEMLAVFSSPSPLQGKG